MKEILTFCLCCSTALALSATASAITIQDQYIGDTGHNSVIFTYDDKDVYGDPDEYDVASMDVTKDNNDLVVVLHGNYFGYWSSDDDYTLGDLFISTNGWHPAESADNGYLDDNSTTGEPWEFVVDLAGTDSHALDNGTATAAATLYSTTDGTVNPGEIRDQQEASFTPGQGATKLDEARWLLSATDMTLTITIPGVFATSFNSNNPWDFNNLGFHWTMTCGNDVIEGGTNPVPEPATLLLFGAGLAGLGGLARRGRRRHHPHWQ